MFLVKKQFKLKDRIQSQHFGNFGRIREYFDSSEPTIHPRAFCLLTKGKTKQMSSSE